MLSSLAVSLITLVKLAAQKIRVTSSTGATGLKQPARLNIAIAIIQQAVRLGKNPSRLAIVVSF